MYRDQSPVNGNSQILDTKYLHTSAVGNGSNGYLKDEINNSEPCFFDESIYGDVQPNSSGFVGGPKASYKFSKPRPPIEKYLPGYDKPTIGRL